LGSFADFLSGVFSLLLYVIVLVGVYKVFQVSAEVTEIKNAVAHIRRLVENGPAPAAHAPSVPVSAPHSAESLVRAIHSSSYDLDAIIDQPDAKPL